MSENVEALARTSVTIDDVYRITLCGSTRFRDEYELWNKRLTLAGFLVYSVSGFGHAGDTFTSEEKDRLDQVHLAKIDASHAIVVINPGGYVGDSTRREIAHATAAGKGVFYTDQGCPTVYKLRTGPHGSRSMRYRAFDYAARAARAEARPAPVVDREAVARIVDPIAFKCWEATYDYGRRIGDSESEALETAEWAHGKSRDEALAKADAILALLSPATSPGEGSSGGRVQAAPDGATEAQHLTGKPDPNPEWEAKADAAHAAIVAEVGVGNPFDTLTMLEAWKAHAEPADSEGRITFSRSLLDSAADGLRSALELARDEHLRGKAAFVAGAQECREMMARFVEQGGDPHAVVAQSIRANWNPSWGPDPGRPRNIMRERGWLGPDLHDRAEALIARSHPAERDASSPAEGRAGTPATDEPQSPSRDDAGGGG